MPAGTITEAGVRTNLSVGVQYLEAWLGGLGCVPLYNLMEDAATSEISRAQLWQWIACAERPWTMAGRSPLDLCERLMAEEPGEDLAGKSAWLQRYDRGNFPRATELFLRMIKAPHLDEFLTLPAYELPPSARLICLIAPCRGIRRPVHPPWVAEETLRAEPISDREEFDGGACATSGPPARSSGR